MKTLGTMAQAVFNTLTVRDVVGEGTVDWGDKDDVQATFDSVLPYLVPDLRTVLWATKAGLDNLVDNLYFKEVFRPPHEQERFAGIYGWINGAPLICDEAFAPLTRTWAPLEHSNSMILLRATEDDLKAMRSNRR